MLVIGSHVSFGADQILGSLKEALSYDANTFMFYTGAPTNTVRKDIDNDKLIEAKKLMAENNIDINNIIVHAPYIVNLANRNDEDKYQFSINFLKQELKRCSLLGISKMVLHPGSAVGTTRENGIENIINGLNEILSLDYPVTILLETMAGKGSELGVSIAELKTLINGVEKQEHIGVCLDTCHLNDGGYNMNEFDNYLDEFDREIGIEKICCIHVNDSKNLLATHKDRHANIGFGTIGFDAIINIIYNDRIKDIPRILETPYIGENDEDKKRLYPPYKFEIEMIRNKTFDPKVLDKIRNFYK